MAEVMCIMVAAEGDNEAYGKAIHAAFDVSGAGAALVLVLELEGEHREAAVALFSEEGVESVERQCKRQRLSWSQPLCDDCWDTRHPDHPSPRLGLGDLETCVDCGRDTYSGIYFRVDPQTVAYPTKEK